jgi:hypothetical protein
VLLRRLELLQQHLAYDVCVSIRQHTSAYVLLRRLELLQQHLAYDVCISIRQHTSAYVLLRRLELLQQHLAYDVCVSIRQHTCSSAALRSCNSTSSNRLFFYHTTAMRICEHNPILQARRMLGTGDPVPVKQVN